MKSKKSIMRGSFREMALGTSALNNNLLAIIIFAIFLLAVFIPNANAVQMGGSMQGTPLSFTTTNGIVTTLAGSGGQGATDGTGIAVSFGVPSDITTDGTNLFIADQSNHKIRKIVISTGVVTTLAGSGAAGSADGTGTAASFNYPYGLTTDGTNLFVADQSNHKIRKIVISTGVVTTIAGSGAAGSADGTGTAASFNLPRGITTDGTNLFVADYNTHKIRKIVISTGVVTTLAGSGAGGSTDGTGTGASFYYPIGITTDGTNLFVADYWNDKIRMIVISTGVVTTLAGSTNGSTDGTGAAAKFSSPRGITTDGTNLFVGDYGNHKIRRIVISTGVVTTLAGSGAAGAADGTSTAASFNYPEGIITDGTNLFVVDTSNNKIRKIAPSLGGSIQGTPLNLDNTNAVVTTFAGSGTAGSTDATGTAASFNLPQGITTDGTYLYVADKSSHKIRKLEISTGAVTTLAGSGAAALTNGTGTGASFYFPDGITTDGTNLYVADSSNHAVRKIVISTGVVTTIAGGTQGSTDATGASASFNYPAGITTDGTYLYVADAQNNKIRKVEINTGVVTTLAGSGASGSTDAAGVAATFSGPYGVTTDGANLYVTDTNNNKIRKIVISSAVVTTLAGSGTAGSTDGTGAAATFYWPEGITTDGTNLYVTDSHSSTNKVRKIVISTAVVTTLAGSGTAGSTDGTGTAASFNQPRDITTDGISLYVADMYSHKIRKISPPFTVTTTATNGTITSINNPAVASGATTTITGSASANYYFAGVSGCGGTAQSNTNELITTFLYTTGTISSNCIVTATFALKTTTPVLKGGAIQGNTLNLDNTNAVVTTLAGSGTAGSTDATGTAASFYYPWGITTDGTNLFVADFINHKIRKIVISTGVVTTLAGSGVQGSTDATGTAARFNYPLGMTTDGTNLFVVDNYNNKIRKIVISTGVVTTLAGSGAAGSTDATGTAASFYDPIGITTDGTNLFVVDRGNNEIRKIVISTGVVTTLAGSGTTGSTDATGTAASFNSPGDITTDGTNLFVTDGGNNKIRKIVIATGVVTTLAGSGAAGSTDGTGTAASFNYPAGITTDGTNLFVADVVNNKIRKVAISTGVVTTLAGSGTAGSTEGTGTAASFNSPRHITTDGTNLFVADYNNNKIRKISPETTPPTGTNSINAGAAYSTSTSVTLTLSCSDSNGCTEMQFSNDDVSYSAAEAYTTGKAWTLTVGDGTKTVYVKFKDTAGNWSTAYSDTIMLDSTLPAVSSTSPTSGATGVALNSNVTVTWSENVDCATVNTTNVTVSAGGWTLSSCSGNQAVFTTSGQANSATYTVTVTTAVKDASGNNMAASYVWSFTTVAIVLSPVNGSCGASNGKTLTASPGTDLCSYGTASSVSGAGPWSWTCSGQYGGDSVSCSALLQKYTVSANAGAGGVLDPASSSSVTVARGSTAGFTFNADSGYHIAAITDTCGGAGYANASNDVSTYTYITGSVLNDCVVSASFGRSVCTPPPSNLAGWWKGEDNAEEVFGLNNGALYGGATYVNGKAGRAFSFDGSGAYADFGNGPAVNISSAVTVMAWVKHNTGSPAQWEDMVMKGNTSYGLQFDGGGFTFHLTSGGWKNLNSGVKPAAGQWYHVAGTYDGSEQRIYIDGLLENSSLWSGQIEANSDPLTFGFKAATDNNYLNGAIDEVQIYDRALSAAEVTGIYNASSLGLCTVPKNTLSVTVAGNGAVSSSPLGISCGITCSAVFTSGAQVTLTAMPASDSFFTGWSGGCTGTGSCTIVVGISNSVTATFAPVSLPLLTAAKSGTGSGSIISTAPGISCGTSCSQKYSAGRTVTLNAKPDADSKFTGWSGCDKIRGSYCTVTMNIDKTITAAFEKGFPKMEISLTGNALDFGEVKRGRLKTKTLKITNNGTGNLRITSVEIDGADNDMFRKRSGTATIKPGKSSNLKVMFKPRSRGVKSANLKINSNDPANAEVNIQLNGTGK